MPSPQSSPARRRAADAAFAAQSLGRSNPSATRRALGREPDPETMALATAVFFWAMSNRRDTPSAQHDEAALAACWPIKGEPVVYPQSAIAERCGVLATRMEANRGG